MFFQKILTLINASIILYIFLLCVHILKKYILFICNHGNVNFILSFFLISLCTLCFTGGCKSVFMCCYWIFISCTRESVMIIFIISHKTYKEGHLQVIIKKLWKNLINLLIYVIKNQANLALELQWKDESFRWFG